MEIQLLVYLWWNGKAEISTSPEVTAELYKRLTSNNSFALDKDVAISPETLKAVFGDNAPEKVLKAGDCRLQKSEDRLEMLCVTIMFSDGSFFGICCSNCTITITFE